MTLRNRYIVALNAAGSIIVPSRSSKFIKMTAPSKKGVTCFFFLGASGSVRIGTTRAESLDVGKRFKKKLLEAESNI